MSGSFPLYWAPVPELGPELIGSNVPTVPTHQAQLQLRTLSIFRFRMSYMKYNSQLKYLL